MGMFGALFAALVAYAVTAFLGYVVHWAMHQRWSGPLRKAHMVHHLVLYPPKDLVSDSYRSAGSSSSVWSFVAALIPLMCVPIILALLSVVSWASAALAFFAMAFVGIASDVVHDSFHVKDHILSKLIPRYDVMRALHFQHHRNMKRNFGIFSFICDRLFRTLQKP